MNRSRFVSLCGLVLILFIAACAGVKPPPTAPPSIDPAPYLSKAQAAEQAGDIQKALVYLRLADGIKPGDQAIAAQRARLDLKIRNKAAQHYKRGQANFRQKKFRSAQREFMATLRYDPNHAGALDFLKNRLSPPSSRQYKVARGDSLKTIAKKIYKDPRKAFLIAYFNDLKPNAKPVPGSTLNLPKIKGMARVKASKPTKKRKKEAVAAASRPAKEKAVVTTPELAEEGAPGSAPEKVDPEEALLTGYGEADDVVGGVGQELEPEEKILTIYEEQESEIAQELIQARYLMEKRDYDAVIPLSQQILEKEPTNEEAGTLVNAAYYQKGIELNRKRKYLESLEMYEEVEPGFRDVDSRIKQVHKVLKKQAEQHYRQGVNYYVNENLAGAIDSWEKTLSIDPDHQKATQDIEKARRLLKKLQAIQ